MQKTTYLVHDDSGGIDEKMTQYEDIRLIWRVWRLDLPPMATFSGDLNPANFNDANNRRG